MRYWVAINSLNTMIVTTAKEKNASPNTGSHCRSGRNGGWLRPGSAWALLAALFVFMLVPATSAADVLTFQQGDGKGSPSDTDDAEIREAPGSFTQAILANIEDVEEYASGPNLGDMDTGSSDLEFNPSSDSAGSGYFGLRYTNVIIPKNATIISAKIQFEVDENPPESSDPLTVTFRGEAADDAAAFTSTAFNLTSRAQTSAFVDWVMPDWPTQQVEGPDQLSAELKTIVQEIVDRPGWISGNALVLMKLGWSGTGERTAEARDGNSDDPELIITFTENLGTATTLNIDASPNHHAVVKFPNIFGGGVNQIPLGSTIDSATLTMNVSAITAGDPSVYQITESWVESEVIWPDRSDGVSWANAGADGTSSHKTTAEGTFPMGATGSQVLDVTTSVANWSAGEINEGWVFIDNSSDDAEVDSSEHATAANRPQLSVTYTLAGGGSACPIDVFIAVENDDAEENTSGGTMDLTSSDLELIMDSSNHQTVGLRFVGLDIDQGANITNAYVEFTAQEAVKSDPSTLTFYAHDIDSAPIFTSTSGDISNRTKTSASVTWASVPTWDTNGAQYQSPDISAVIQEVVDRGSWTNNNDIAIIITGTAGSWRVADAHGTGTNVKLHVECSAAATPAVTSAVAEISPNDVTTNSTGNSFSYDIQATISGGNTGVNRVAITVPGTFTVAASPVTDVLVGGSSVAFTDNTVGNAISVDLTTKVTTSSQITVLFDADAPTSQDLTGVDFTSTVDDSGTGDAAQSTTMGNGDGDAGDNDSWTVTTTDAAGALAAHWPFDEGTGQIAGDVSGNLNDGTLGPTSAVESGNDPTWACVAGGNALDFDGTDDEVKLSFVTIGDSAAWTITAWIKMSADSADQRTIYSEGNTGAEEYLFLYVDDSTDHAKFWIKDAASGMSSMESTTNVKDDAWHLITLVQRSKTDRELYVGTSSESTNTYDPGTLASNTASIGFLRASSWTADSFKGMIDDVRIYDYALSTGEISTLASSPPGACAGTPAVTSAVAEISPTDVATSSTGNSFSYDIQTTISGGDTGVDRVAITVPGTFTVAASPVTDVLVGGSSVTFTDNTVGNVISVDLTTKVTTSSQITVLFNADAPTTQDLTGVAFLSTVDDSGTGDAAQSTTEGNGDGDAGDADSWTVTTTDAGACAIDPTGTYIEAENYVPPLVPGTGSGTFLVQSSLAGFNDTGYLIGSGGNTTNPPDNERADYTVNFTTIDTYYVWIRGYGVDSGSDSVFMGLDGTLAGALNDNGIYNQWIWSDGFQDGVRTIDVTTTGQHTINLWVREPNHSVDAIYITQDAGAIPGGTSIGIPTGATIIDPNNCGSTPAVTSAVAEISPTDVTTSSTGNSFSYDIQATISGGDTGVDRVAITVPGTFTVAASPVTDVLVGGSSVTFTDNTVGNVISVDLTTKVTTSSQITVLFDADAPTTEDLTGVAFLSTVDDSGTGDAAQSTTEGNGDGDAGDADSWTVTTTDAAAGGLLAEYWVDEAASGQVPTILVDNAGTPLNMPLAYVATSPGWEDGTGGNRHLRFYGTGDTTDTGGAVVDTDTTKIDAIHGAQKATIVAKYAMDSNVCTTNGDRIFGISDGDGSADGWFAMRERLGRDALLVRWAGIGTYGAYALGNGTPSCPIDTVATVHWVVDTTQGVAADRVRAYIDGVAATVQVTNGALPPLNATIDLGSGTRRMFLGRAHAGIRTFRGRVWYAALYDSALSAAAVASDATAINTCDDLGVCANAITSAVAEISPTDVVTSSTANAFSYDIQATIGGSDTGVNRVAITVPGTFTVAASPVTDVLVGGSSVTYSDNTVGNAISVDLTTKVTTSSQITVLFDADAPTTEDLTGVAFLSTVDDSGTGDAAQSTTMGNGDGDAGDADSWTVTTTDAAVPIAHWTFDEGSGQTAADSAGTNDGTLGPTTSADAEDPTWACVTGGNALEFDGTDDYVDIPPIGDGYSAITVSAWMKAKTFASENYNPIVARDEAGGTLNDVFALMARDAVVGNEASFRIYVGAGNTKVTARSSISLSTDTWYHLVGTYDGAAVRVYLDGIEKGNTAQSGTLSTEATRIALGRFSNNDYVNFDGLIDEVRIYDRALSPAEITALAASAPIECAALAVTSAVAEISPNDVTTSSTGNAFSYDIQATISGGDTGVDRVAITVPGTFTVAASPVTDVLVGGSSVTFTDNTVGNTISVDLTTKVTTSGQITVLFDADAPTSQDLTGVAFLSTVDDSGTGDAAQSTTEGNGDGDAGDNDSWTVTTTDGAPFSCPIGSDIFNDGFEAGNLSAWDGSSAETGDSVTASTDQANSGTYSLKGQVDNVTDAQAMVWKNIAGQTEIHAKVELFVPTGFLTTDNVTVLQFLNNWSNILSLSINDDMTLYLWNTGAAEAYGFQATTTLTTNAWHTFEVRATISDTVGEARFWLDGNLEITATGKNLGTNPVDRFSTGYYWGTPRTEANTVYIDDAVLCGAVTTPAVTSAVAEISQNDVATSSTANAFSYDIQATIGGGDTGVNRVAITVPGTFTVAASPVSDVLVGGVPVAFTDNTVGNAISVDLTTKVTTSSQITVLFDADAPTSQDLTGVTFLSTVDDSGTGDAAQSTTEGDGDGDAGDANSWTVTTTDAPAGPIAHWTFDEGTGLTAADSIGTLDGTLTNGPSWSAGAGGDYALQFDGVDQFVSVADDPALTPSGDMTIAGWIRFDVLPGTRGEQATIAYARHGVSPWFSYKLQVSNANTPFFMWFNSSATGWNVNSTNETIVTDTWYHLAGVLDGTTLRIYLNGTDANSNTQTISGTMLDSDSPLALGAEYSGDGRVDGCVDEVRLYNRALTAGEISALAASAPTGCAAAAVTSAVAEISPNDVTTSSTGNAFSYDIQATISGGDTGVNRVAITVPGTFTVAASPVTDVLVGGSSVAFTDNTVGNAISVDLTTKVTTSSQITVLFDADAPTSQDLTGVDFLSTVDDSGTGDAAQFTTEGNGDGNAGDANSWTVTTTDASSLTPLGRYCFNEAGSGTVPTTVLDDQASPINLSITYGTGNAWFTHASGHRGLNAASDPHVGIATGVANGTKYSTNLEGVTQATFALVADWLPAADTQRIGGFFRSGDSGNGYFMVDGSGRLMARFRAQGVAQITVQWPTSWEDGVRRVFHVVYDSDHTTASSRIRLYMNGVDQGAGTLTQGAWPTLGLGLDFSAADLDLSFLNEPDLGKPLHGTVYHYAVYDSELTDPEISTDATALLADDDCGGGATPAVTSAVAEISPNDVATSSTANAFSYDIQATIGGGDTGVDRVAITVPGTFTTVSVTDVQVGGVPVAFTDNTVGNAISVDLTTKVTASDRITVLFAADAPTSQDLTGVDFLSTVDDSGTGDAPPATTEGNGDGDAGDANSWTVTTTDVAGGDVYYSVGTDGADLKTGLPNLSIVSGTATLTVAQTGNSGVGDEIDYDSGNKIAYIKSVISQTQFVVHTATGGVPGNVTSVSVNAIRRAFNTLATAEANSGDASHLTTFDLTGTGAAANLTWVAYADGAFTAGANINGYTTDATHFITLTVAGSSQVASGTSQRHNGTAGTGVVLDGQDLVGGVEVNDDYTQFEWFEIIRTAGANGRAAATAKNATNVIFDHLLIHNYTTGFASYGIKGSDNSTFTVRNCIIYDGGSSGIRLSGLTSTGIVQNCTVYGIAGNGIYQDDGTVTVTNSISMGNTTDFNGGTQSYNLSSDATATGTGSLINKVAADQFVNITAGSEDLHLKTAADAIDTGTDLSGSFTDDIDDDARPIGAQWDIGADETSAAGSTLAVTSAVAEISPNDVVTSSTGNSFSYDIQATISGGDTGVDRVAITVPGTFTVAASPVTDVLVGGSSVAFTDNTVGNAISVDLTTKVTTSSQITVLFDADAPTSQDLTGVDFLSTVDDSITGAAPQATTEGNGDGDAGDANSWTVTTTDAAAPIAHWTFDEGSGQTAADSSGNGHSATLGNLAGADAADPTWECVAGGYALNFDGTDDLVNAGSAAALDDLGPMTISAWIKPDTAGASAVSHVMSKSDTGSGRWFLEIDNSAPEDDAFEFNKDHDTDVARVTSNSTVAYDVWQHVAVTWDGSATGANIHTYKDGVEASYQSTINGSGTKYSDAALPFVIGNRGNGNNPFYGLIDDVRVYDYALSTAQITTLVGSAPTDCAAAPAVSSAVAEISPNDVTTSFTGIAFSYDIQATIGGGDSGVNRVAITVPGTFTTVTVTDVLVDGVSVAFTDNTAGNAISVDLTTKVTTSSQITVLFNADAPTTQDLTGVDFLSTVDDSTTGDAPQATTEGNGDGNAGDLNSWTVTTTDAGVCLAVDGAASTGTTAGGSSMTISHTTSGTDRLMLVGVSFGLGAGESVSEVRYNGVLLNFEGAINGPGNDSRIEIWSKVAPDTGMHNVVVTLSAGTHDGATAGVMTFTGVNQATPLGTFASSSGFSANPSTTVSSAADQLVFGVVAGDDTTNRDLIPGAGQSPERWDLYANSANGGGSTEAGAASVVTSWTWSGGSDDWAIGGISIKPAASCGGTAAVTSALAEISPNNVTTSSTGNAFSYDIQATIGGGDTGVDRVAITVPGSFGAPTVTDVLVGGVSVAFTDNTVGNVISVDLFAKVTTSSQITVLFSADAPTTQDLTGVDFLSTVDDSTTGAAPQATTEGNGDGDAVDNNSWTVTTADVGSCAIDPTGSYIEAENFVPPLVPGTGSGTFLVQSSQAGFNGTGYLFSSGGNTTTPPDNERADYTMNFTTTGTYYVWTRGYGLDGGSDSVFIGLDGTWVGALNDNGIRNQWIWSDSIQTGVRTINVATTGQHTINLWVREPNHNVDGIYITQDAGAIPGGTSIGIPTGATVIDPNNCGTTAVTSAVAEISPNDVTTSSTGNAFSYDIQATIGGGDTGVNRVAITVPGTFSTVTVTYVLVGGVSVAFTDNTSGNFISVDLTTKVTTSSQITVVFSADAPTTQDLTGVDFLSTVDDSGTADAPQATTEGDGDGDVADNNSWTVTTTGEVVAGACLAIDGAASTGSTTTSSMTISHTTAGNDRLMIVGVSMDNNQYETVASVSYNSIPLTFVGTEASDNDARVEIWQLTQANGLTTGPHDVDITFSTDLQHPAIAGVMTFSGVDQTTPIGAFFGNMAILSATGSVTVSSAVGELVLGVFSGETVDSVATDPPAVERWNLSLGGTGETEFAAGATDNGAASVTITWPLGDDDHWAAGGVSIKPSVSCGGGTATSSAVAEISPNDVTTNSTANAFSYDIQATIGGGDTGVDRVAITVPASFGPPTVTDVQVGGVSVAFTDNTAANTISVDLAAKVTASSKITVLFSADAPTTEDLTGVDFLSTVDDSGNVDAAQATTEGNGDGDAGDNNDWTVTTTNAALGASCDIDPTGTYIEAENYTSLVSGTGSFLTQSSLAGHNGTGYLMSSGGSTSTPPATERADYTVNFTTTGTYYVWQRGYGVDSGSDSVFIGLDGTWTGTFNDNDVRNQWYWSNSVQAGVNTINVATTGQHTINLWVREGGHAVDGIYITQDSGAIPGGTAIGIPTPGGTGGTFTKRVTLDSDDAEQKVASTFGVNDGSSDLELHDTGGTDGYVGMRWTNVTIPQGATIDDARIQFHVDETNSDVNLTVTFRGEDIDDAPTFTETASDLSDRIETSASVDWAIPHWATTSEEGTDQLTVDLSPIVQEIVGRGGWTSGNAMVIMIKAWSGSGERHAEAHDGEAASAPELQIDYTTGGGSATIIDPSACGGGGAGLIDHFAISHDGNGINCQAEEITISAHDSSHAVETGFMGTISLSTSTAHGVWSVVSGSGSMANSSRRGNGVYAFGAADLGVVVLGLRDTFAETTNIDLTHGIWSEDPGEDPDLLFARAGFNFLADEVNNGIGTQIGGKASNVAPGVQALKLQAVRTSDDTGACEAALIGPTTIEFAFECENPSTCVASQVDISGTNITDNAGGSALSYTGVSLDFEGPTDSKAAFTLSYPDVGQLQLHVRLRFAPSGEWMLGASNEFVVRPFALHVTASGNPAATSAAGSVFTSAGTNFTANVTAVLWDAADDIDADGIADSHNDSNPANNADLSDNLIALNYGQESFVEQVLLTAALDQPAGGVDPGLSGGYQYQRILLRGRSKQRCALR